MNQKIPQYFAFATAFISIIFAMIILIFSEGSRKWYSGGFFILIGIVMIFNYLNLRRNRR